MTLWFDKPAEVFHYDAHECLPSVREKLFEGVRRSLERRGDASTGWSMAWKMLFWARLGDRAHANDCTVSAIPARSRIGIGKETRNT